MTNKGRLRSSILYGELQTRALRLEDLEVLAAHFIEEVNREQGKDVEGLDPECLAALKAYPWPGNVREFRNALEQAVVTREHGQLTLQDLPEEIYRARHKEDSFVVQVGSTLKSVEHELIQRTLDAADGNRSRTARILGVHWRTLYDLMKRNGFPPRRTRSG